MSSFAECDAALELVPLKLLKPVESRSVISVAEVVPVISSFHE